MSFDKEIFGNKKFSDILKDIYENQKKKDRQINQLIAQLQPLIKNASDATIIVPLIKEYLDVAVKNDDHLVKLTAIVQRYISTKQTISGADSLLSEEEKQQLLRVAEQTLSSELTDELDSIEQESAALKQRISNSTIQTKEDVSE